MSTSSLPSPAAAQPAAQAAAEDQRKMHVVVVGHVDHGKSTFVGRLLNDTDSLPNGKIEQVRKNCAAEGMEFEYAFLLDALIEEQEQNITIDTTRIFFRTTQRAYAIIDAPGHKEFLKNMVTGAASASAALLLIDAKEGVMDQSRRHAFLLSLLGVKQLVVLVNKMDLVQHSQETYEKIRTEYTGFLKSLGLNAVHFIPIAAKHGENIVNRSTKMAWWTGPTVTEALDGFAHEDDLTGLPLRLPVSDIYRFDHRRIIAGRVEAGAIRPGDELIFQPGGRRSTVRTFEDWPGPESRSVVGTGGSASVTLSEQIFVERGQVASHPSNQPRVGREFRARIFWLGKEPLVPKKTYKLRLLTQNVEAVIARIEKITDASTLESIQAGSVPRDSICEVVVRTTHPVAFDLHHECAITGRFALEEAGRIHGGGIILEAHKEQSAREGKVTAAERGARFGHAPAVLWFTGLSGSGKSTIAELVERRLFDAGRQVFRVDGDDLRTALNRDLGFSAADRAESVRRASAVAGLFANAGHISLVTLIAPLAADRAKARAALSNHAFIEVFVDAPLDVCEQRDVKGLYAKARRGEIAEFTGISSPYEAPESPEVHIRTDKLTTDQAVDLVLDALDKVLRSKADDWEV
jgi:bifunctional enzyme CysN/CysC